MGSCLLRGVLTPSGWPGNPVDTTCPCHQAPSPIPRPCQGHEGWQRVLPPPQSFPGGTEVGVLGGGDTVKTRTNACTQWERVGAAQTWLYWEYGAKPSSSPQLPFMSSQSCSGWGAPRIPNPPTAPLSLHPSTALGDAGGHPVFPVPCSQHPRGRPMGSTTSKRLVAPMSLMEQDMVPMQPPSLGLLQHHEVPRCLWGPPCTHQGQGWGPLDPQQHPSPAMGWWPLSEPPPWGQVPWG